MVTAPVTKPLDPDDPADRAFIAGEAQRLAAMGIVTKVVSHKRRWVVLHREMPITERYLRCNDCQSRWLSDVVTALTKPCPFCGAHPHRINVPPMRDK